MFTNYHASCTSSNLIKTLWHCRSPTLQWWERKIKLKIPPKLSYPLISTFDYARTQHVFLVCVCFLCVCVCVSCAAGPGLLGLMASIWVIFPLAPNEEEDPGRFPSLADSEEDTQTCMGWMFLSGDSSRTSSSSKSNLHNSPPSSTVYYPAFPLQLLIQTRHLYDRKTKLSLWWTNSGV